MSLLRFNFVSIFPQLLQQALNHGVVGQAVKNKLVSFQCVNPRQFTTDFHKTVDDRPYGGGDGMVMLAQPLGKAIESFGAQVGRRILLSAQGETWSDKKAREWARSREPLTLICGRYSGVDQRFINNYVDEEISIGDYVLSGGEFAALVIVDTVTRFVPGVLGNRVSVDEESYANGLLEAPLFTRPNDSFNQRVPEVLLNGDHKRISDFREALSIFVTWKKRPDLALELDEKSFQRAEHVAMRMSDSELESCGLTRKFITEVTAEVKKKEEARLGFLGQNPPAGGKHE